MYVYIYIYMYVYIYEGYYSVQMGGPLLPTGEGKGIDIVYTRSIDLCIYKYIHNIYIYIYTQLYTTIYIYTNIHQA